MVVAANCVTTMTRRVLERLLRTPGVTIFSIVAIAIGIAATTVVYSAIRGLLDPPGADRFERVANLYASPYYRNNRESSFSQENIEYLRATQQSFEHLGVCGRACAQSWPSIGSPATRSLRR